MDEDAVRRARGGARKQGFIIGLVIAAFAGVVCWTGGKAATLGEARTRGVQDAHDIAVPLVKAKESLEAMRVKLEEGAKSLIADRKYPTTLSQELAGMTVDFGGDVLFGRRLGPVPAETTRQLFDFITRVQALNSKKDLVVSLLAKLQKPISEEFSRPPGQFPLNYVVVVDKETPSMGAMLASLVTPIPPESKTIPNDFKFLNPNGGGNVQLPRLTSEKVPKDGAAIPIVPRTFEAVCPSKTKGQVAQLVSSMSSIVDDIAGQKAAEGGDYVTESKAGLAELAGKLAESLHKVN
ncbi:MAG: hypothetical protein ABTD50_08550 [Polyangiaceae bacterium]